MGFVSFVGRVLFASIFLLSAYQEYVSPFPSFPPPDLVRPSLAAPVPYLRRRPRTHFRFRPCPSMRLDRGALFVNAHADAVRSGPSGAFLVGSRSTRQICAALDRFSEFGSDGGPAAKSLKPKFNQFVKQVSANIGMSVPHIDIKTVIAATMFLKALGGLLLIISSSFGAFLLLIYLAFITPVVYDFYNHEMESQQFVQLFTQFSQNLALFGALLFFLGMKNSILRRHPKRRTTKAKTT
uniref:Uncharacterized protein n=1 Tax=Avena sativa TaxID=4498 RepID=A0ACD5V144_AVESA